MLLLPNVNERNFFLALRALVVLIIVRVLLLILQDVLTSCVNILVRERLMAKITFPIFNCAIYGASNSHWIRDVWDYCHAES